MRLFTTLLALLLPIAASAQNFTGGARVGQSSQRSVIFITIDDVGTEMLPQYNNVDSVLADATLPALDSMAANGMRAVDHHAAPNCTPARAAWMLGQYQFRIGSWGVGSGENEFPQDPDHHLATLISGTGAEVVFAGKENPISSEDPASPDYLQYYPIHYGFDSAYTYLNVQPDKFYVWEGVEVDAAGLAAAVIADDYTTDVRTWTDGDGGQYVDTASTNFVLSAYASRDRSKRFFAQLSLANVHLPVHNPGIYPGDAAGCTGAGDPDSDSCLELRAEAMDAEIGRVLAAVDANTFVIVASDNGSAGGPTSQDKGTVYEGGVRTPMFVIGPGVPAGTTIDDAISQADMAITLADLMGVTSYGGSEVIDGYSFSTEIGQTCNWTDNRCWSDRTGYIAESLVGSFGDPDGGFQSFRDSLGPYPDHKLQYRPSTGASRLVNLSSYAGWGAEPSDLCGGDDDCTGLTGTNRLAFNHLCETRNAIIAMDGGCPFLLLAAPAFGSDTTDDDSISIPFGTVTDADHYETCWYETGVGSCSWSTDTTPLDATSLTPGTNYTLKVRGVDADGRAGAEDTETISTTGGAGGGAGACTDGVNCLCDTISPASTLLGCEDFERAGFYDASEATNWTSKEDPSAHTCYRGQAAPWVEDFGGTGAALTNSGEPATPRIGCTCDAGGSPCQMSGDWCSAAQGFVVDGGGADCWQRNSGGIPLDIQRSGDYDAEVAGLTLTGGIGASADVLGGNAHLAHRVGPGDYNGIMGTMYLKAGANHGTNGDNTNATEVGVTMLLAYSSNIGTEADSVIDAQWKHNEWGTDGQSDVEHWNLGITGCGGLSEFPYRPFLWIDSQGACDTALAGATVTVGDADCIAPALRLCSTTAYDQATDFPFGTVACHQAHIKGLGTSDVDIEIKHNGTTVIKLENFDGSALRNDYYSNFVWNSYSNLNEDGDGTSNDTDVTQYRYEDNIVVVNGPPESCASIGF